MYLGVTPVRTAELAEKVKGVLSNHPERTFYIKADARTSYASLVKVLDCVRAAGVQRLALLTAQRESGRAGTHLVQPKGLEFLVPSISRYQWRKGNYLRVEERITENTRKDEIVGFSRIRSHE